LNVGFRNTRQQLDSTDVVLGALAIDFNGFTTLHQLEEFVGTEATLLTREALVEWDLLLLALNSGLASTAMPGSHTHRIDPNTGHVCVCW